MLPNMFQKISYLAKDAQWFKQLVIFGFVGVLNTIISISIIIILFMQVFQLNYIISNICGYIAGIINSYIYNKKLTFKGNSPGQSNAFMRFIFAFIISYVVQLAVVIFCKEVTEISTIVCQLIGIVCYTGVNFCLSKFFVFRRKEVESENAY